jgi:hypothetical protein
MVRTMDEIARRYLLLALRIDRRRPGFVAWYAGATELAEAVAGEPLPLAVELHAEASSLRGLVELAEPGLRATWLTAQLDAMIAVTRILDGEEIAYPELVEELLDQRIEAAPEAAALTAHQLLEAALPAGGSLAERLAAHREASRLTPEQVAAGLDRALDLLRRRTAQDIGLPADERLEVVMRSGVPRGWQPITRGPMTSVLEVDPAGAWTLADLYRLAQAALTVEPGLDTNTFVDRVTGRHDPRQDHTS